MAESPTVEQITVTLAEVVRLLNGVVASAALAEDPRRIYSLEQVAEITGWSLVSLQRDCRDKRIPFVRKGKAFGLTSKMLDAEIARRSEIPAGHLVALPDFASRPQPGNRRTRRDAA